MASTPESHTTCPSSPSSSSSPVDDRLIEQLSCVSLGKRSIRSPYANHLSENLHHEMSATAQPSFSSPSRPYGNAKRATTHPTPLAIRQLKEEEPLPNSSSTTIVPPVTIIAPEECFYHVTSDSHQESVGRLDAIVGGEGVLKGKLFEELEWFDGNTKSVVLADMLRVHESKYIEHLRTHCKRAENPIDGLNKEGERSRDGFFDTDTRLSSGTWQAAVTAAGAAIQAVDIVMKQEHKKVFVASRPPGHHAGHTGAVQAIESFWCRPDMCSCGFCLLNNVAIAAAYARYKYGGDGIRVAIVDFDIHHGNGTEDIIKNICPRSVTLPLPSSWPRTTVDVHKPWYDEHDKENVFFGSINLVAGGGFYPGSGSGEDDDRSEWPNVINVRLDPIEKGPEPGDLRARKRLSAKERAACCKKASEQFRARTEQQLLGQLAEFAPNLLLISAGFDGHVDDFYHYLTEEDYAWITQRFVQIMQPHGGRIVSVLEGGYNLESPYKSQPSGSVNKKKSMKRGGTQSFHRTRQQTASSDPSSSVASPPEDLTIEESTEEPTPPPEKEWGGLAKGVRAHVRSLMGSSS